ncbi:hypothetical protein [Desulfofustis limnaeus]|uniref:Uncharacterized protein n=1 Tax=Desulfofustis limnaeus TaxID=2740163 RepID=A0ABM7WCE1_9BACT|nr:hypothetical protein [Desulfofustis limnaeus]BDD88709.1 hypothetical protein DPPLL_30740 [Desulfofustis limnaeus]
MPIRLSSLERRRLIDQEFRQVGIRPGLVTRTAQAGQRAEPPGDDEGLLWTLTTEMPATVWDWERYDFVSEVLLMAGMLVPAVGQVPLLDSHSRWSCDDVLGSVRDFVDATQGQFLAKDARVYFAADEKSRRTRQKVVDRHLLDGSVGYQVLKAVWIPDGEEAAIGGRVFQGPLKVSYSWLLKEFSVTPVGADVLAKVRTLCGAGR